MKRRIFLISFALLAGGFLATQATAEIPDLTGDVWSVCGDDGSSTWHDTRLVFTHHENGLVEGHFDWRSSNGSFGREMFTGSVKPDGALRLQGGALEDSQSLVTSRYHGTVSADGRSILDGVWLDGLPGVWAATRDGGQGTAAPLCDTAEPVS